MSRVEAKQSAVDQPLTFVSTQAAPTPAGHYSQAVQAGGFLYVSGMLPGPLQAGETEGFDRQVHAALGHCKHVLEAAGYALTDVVQCTAYIVGVALWPRFNELYASVFGAHKPARAVVPVPELHHGFLIEIQLVAYKQPADAATTRGPSAIS